MVRHQTTIPSCFKVLPIVLKEDFQAIEKCVAKGGDIPFALKFAVFYNYSSTNILYKDDFESNLTNTVIYIPTAWFLDYCLHRAFKAKHDAISFNECTQYKIEVPSNRKSQLSWMESNMAEIQTIIHTHLHGKLH